MGDVHLQLRRTKYSVLSTKFCMALAVLLFQLGACAADTLTQADVFTAGREGYHSYRIPVLLVAKNGILLAICEGRKTGRGDHGDVDLVQKRRVPTAGKLGDRSS